LLLICVKCNNPSAPEQPTGNDIRAKASTETFSDLQQLYLVYASRGPRVPELQGPVLLESKGIELLVEVIRV
jgi:hypothetical protein